MINFKEGYLPEYFRLDSTGYSGWSSLPSQFEIEKYSYDDFKKLKLAHVPKASVNLRPRPYIVFFSQLPSDTVMSISNFTQAEILESLVKYGEKFCCDVFLKIHPVYMKRIKKNIQSVRDHEFEFCIADFIKKGRVQLIDESVHSLAQSAKAIFTTNSTTGFESLLHEKPVFTFANSDYQLATYRTKTSEWALWEDVIKNHEKKSIIADFVLTYLNKYSFNYEEKGLEGKIIKYMTQYFRARDSAHRSKECQSMNSQTILANICDNLF